VASPPVDWFAPYAVMEIAPVVTNAMPGLVAAFSSAPLPRDIQPATNAPNFHAARSDMAVSGLWRLCDMFSGMV